MKKVEGSVPKCVVVGQRILTAARLTLYQREWYFSW